MNVRATLMLRLFLVAALCPALAGCMAQEGLQRADLTPAATDSGTVVPPWSSVDEATLRPGVILHTEMRDCPTNFFFVRPDNGAVFLGTPSYCVRDLPIGSVAGVGDDNDLAILVYSSLQTMYEINETDPDALEYNDLAVFHLDTASRRFANPTLQGGGPRELADGASYQIGDRLQALTEGQWREAVVTTKSGDWALHTYTVSPGTPGNLGGPVVDEQGRAVGTLSTLGVFPNPGMNGVARLDTMMEYALEHAKLQMVLATP